MILKSDPSIRQCGPGGSLGLSLDFAGKSIVRLDDAACINLHDREWEYGFTEDAPLQLSFASNLAVAGYAVPVDAEGRFAGTPVELARTRALHLYTCERPTATEEPRIMIWFVEQLAKTSIGLISSEGPLPPKPILPPTEAQPKTILKPKRSCPTIGSSGGPTGRE
jgi:hypothetical protein